MKQKKFADTYRVTESTSTKFCLRTNYYKTGVINDPLGQPTVPVGSDCFGADVRTDGRTYGQTDVRTD